MPRVFLAVAGLEERSSIRQLLGKMESEVVGEAVDWPTTLAQAPVCRTEFLVVDWNLLPIPAIAAIEELRTACGGTLVIALLSQFDARQQAALSIGADVFISRCEMPESVAQRLKTIAESIRTC
jgi:DNA-binding NarL/FixJ family response regulator